MKTDAPAEGLTAFAEDLATSPNITDTTDSYQCGQVRGYFGFAENFIHDEAICQDIEQLKFSRDFEFLQEFFNQGDKVSGPDPSGEHEKKTLEPFVLDDIDRSK